MSVVQEICDRTALATGKDLGRLIAKRFQRVGQVVIGILIVALIAANTLNIAADLAAIGAGMRLLHAGPAPLWAFVAGIGITVMVVAGSFAFLAKVFKVLCAGLLAYIGVLFAVRLPWGDVVTHLLIPHLSLSQDYLSTLVAVLGTTISPYLFFWQSAERVEALRAEPEGGEKARGLEDRPDSEGRRRPGPPRRTSSPAWRFRTW